MPALHDYRNGHGFPLSCCEFHGMADGCSEGKTCPARKAGAAKPVTPAPQLHPFDWALLAVAIVILLSAYLY